MEKEKVGRRNKMICPRCKEELNSLGVTFLVAAKLDSSGYHDKEIEEIIDYFCPVCRYPLDYNPADELADELLKKGE